MGGPLGDFKSTILCRHQVFGSKLGPLNSQNLLLGCAGVVATSDTVMVVFLSCLVLVQRWKPHISQIVIKP